MKRIVKKASCFMLMMAMFLSLFAGIDMKVMAATNWETESNNTYATADVIALGDTVKGKMSASNDYDYYVVSPSANGKIEINFMHTYQNKSYSWYVQVYLYENGEYKKIMEEDVALNDNEKVRLPYIGAVSGQKYYIMVRCYSDSMAGIEYSVGTTFTKSDYYEKELNGDYARATMMALGKTYKGNMRSTNDYDYFKFVPSSNGKIDISFLHTYQNKSTSWYVDVYLYEDGEYTKITEKDIALDDNENVKVPYIGAVKGKTYYIMVRCYSESIVGVEYSINVSLTASDYYEKEFNGQYSIATPMVLGKTYKGNLKSSQDYDYYKVIMPAKGMLKVSFGHTYENKSNSWIVELFQYSNGEYKKLQRSDVAMNDKSTFTLPATKVSANGVYYIVVRGYSDSLVGKEYTVNATYNLPGVSSVKGTAKKKAIKLTWKKASGMTYQIQIKNGKWKAAKKSTSNNYTYKNLKSKKKYSVRIRCYKKIKGVTYYSAWKTVKVKTK